MIKYKKKLKKGNNGLNIDPVSLLTGLGGTAIQAAGTDSRGVVDPTAGALGKGLQLAGKGFLLGNAVLPGLGGIIGGLGGGLIGAITGGNAAKEQERAAQLAELRERRLTNTTQKNAMVIRQAAHPTKGYGNIGYFAKGGAISTTGGGMQSISDGVHQLVGDQHGMDTNADGRQGITLSSSGRPIAEVEGGEVMGSDKVFSAQMLVPGTNYTFAQAAAMVAKSAESKLVQRFKKKLDKAETSESAFSAKRMLEKHPDPLEALFDTQEQTRIAEEQAAQQQEQIQAQQQQLPQGKKGLNLEALGGAAESIVPFIDNLVNMSITQKTPAIPKPEMQIAPTLDTTYDITGAQASINRQQALRNRGILQNTNNDQVARANMIAGYANDVDSLNQLMMTKAEQERAGRNQQAGLQADAYNANTQLLNNYRQMQMMRTDDIQGRMSANVTNAVEDVQGMQATANLKTLDKQKMMITLMGYASTGVLDRAQVVPAMELVEQGYSLSEAIAMLQKNKQAGGTAADASAAPFSDPLLMQLLGLAGGVRSQLAAQPRVKSKDGK